jgi:hypothetical protein
VSMDLLSEGLDLVTLTPDSESEVHHAPAPHTIAWGHFLGDRMFFNKPYLASIEAEGGFFVVKAKGNLNPTLRCVYTPEGREIKRYRNPPLASVKPKMGRYKALDLDVEWEGERLGTQRSAGPATSSPISCARSLLSKRSAPPIGCAGKSSSCSRRGRAMPICMPSIPPKKTSPKGSSGQRSALPSLNATVRLSPNVCAGCPSLRAKSRCASLMGSLISSVRSCIVHVSSTARSSVRCIFYLTTHSGLIPSETTKAGACNSVWSTFMARLRTNL